jgi:hypothetical protein
MKQAMPKSVIRKANENESSQFVQFCSVLLVSAHFLKIYLRG